jgi:hypothetical protein
MGAGVIDGIGRGDTVAGAGIIFSETIPQECSDHRARAGAEQKREAQDRE